MRYIPRPDAIEPRDHKALLQEVRRRRRQLMMLDDEAEPSDTPRLEPRQLSQPSHAMASTPDAPGLRLAPEFDGAILLARLVMQPP
jgi:hypothetical protein